MYIIYNYNYFFDNADMDAIESVQDSVQVESGTSQSQPSDEAIENETVTVTFDQEAIVSPPEVKASVPSTETPDENRNPTSQPPSADWQQIPLQPPAYSQSALNPHLPTYSHSALNPLPPTYSQSAPNPQPPTYSQSRSALNPQPPVAFPAASHGYPATVVVQTVCVHFYFSLISGSF